MNNPVLLIGTPAYNGMVHIDYLKSVLGLTNKVSFEVMNIGNESLITRARNTIISYFLQNEKYTHLLFLDGDIEISPDDIIKLVLHEKDAIAAPVPMKGLDAQGNRRYNVNNPQLVAGNLYTVDKVGTAVFLLSRKACEYLCKNTDTYEHNGINCYDVFQVGVKDGIYLSEDFYVCDRLQEGGFPVYVDDSIVVGHNGVIKL